ncbi:putative integral membrane protein [Ehrlichia ruminantium]|uniref:Putative integral membrane protein n=1 Tax=Ehrlichia ruminantium TaxID=779 RepID=A0A161M630_EHRRU|nr:hypothetical protein [Ehrlichia ruminantium]GAT77619.1 putative integral membrane protein [Ehrlichia ruminantium]
MNQQIVLASAIGALGFLIRHVSISAEQNVPSNGSSARNAFIGTMMCVGAVAYICSNIMFRRIRRHANERVTNEENVNKDVGQEGINVGNLETSDINESSVDVEDSDICENDTSSIASDSMSADTLSSDLDSDSTASDSEVEEWDLLVDVQVNNMYETHSVNHD